jgi:hypothetical protein
VNILGELIGINTAMVGGANTIGFAIPVDRVRRIVDDLVQFKEVRPVWLGLRGATVTSDSGRASARGLGLRVRSVYPGSPAERAGLAGDPSSRSTARRSSRARTSTPSPPSARQACDDHVPPEERRAHGEGHTSRAPEDRPRGPAPRAGLAVTGRAFSWLHPSAAACPRMKGGSRAATASSPSTAMKRVLDDLNHAELGSTGPPSPCRARGAYAYTPRSVWTSRAIAARAAVRRRDSEEHERGARPVPPGEALAEKDCREDRREDRLEREDDRRVRRGHLRLRPRLRRNVTTVARSAIQRIASSRPPQGGPGFGRQKGSAPGEKRMRRT